MGAQNGRGAGGAVAAIAIALCALGALPSGSDARRPRLERRAERVVLRKLRHELPDGRRVRCRRRSSTRAVCRWRASRELTPNRRRRCRGRYRVRFHGRRATLRTLGRRRCRLVVAAMDPELGFNDVSIGAHTATPEQVARLVEGVGAGLFRLPVDWRWVERRRGTYDMDVYDRGYRALLHRGIRPVILLSGAPRWAWPLLTSCAPTCSVPPAPRFDADWRRMAAELARRYPRAAAIEIWNEPNEAHFWHPRADPARYTDLLREAYEAIKAVRPEMPVLGAGVDGRLVAEGGSMEGAKFLDAVLARGGGSYMDAIAIHPYVHLDSLGTLARLVASLRSVRDARGSSRLPFWTTEIGLSTTGPYAVSEAAQAWGLVRIYRILKAEPDVRAIVIHALIEPSGDRNGSGPGFGVVRQDLSPKPAYCSLRRVVGIRGPCG